MSDTETTNPVAEEDVDTSPAEGVDEAEIGPLLDEDGNPLPEEPSEDDETDEVDHDGKKYRIPKVLKPALMMQADYTRKTQELADQRKAFEADRAKAGEADKEVLTIRATAIALDHRIAQYEAVDWRALEAQDQLNGTNQAATLWRELSQMKEARSKTGEELQQREQTLTLDQQRERAKRVEEGQAVLARDIQGWGPDLAGKLSSFAEKEFGVTRQELAQIDDPRLIKMLHRAMTNTTAQKTQAAKQQAERVETVKPTPKVGGGSNPTRGLDDRLSADEWLKRRNEQVHKNQRA